MDPLSSSSSGPPAAAEAVEGGPQTYTAWDGTVFEDLEAFMKHEMETRYTFKDETGESETKLPGEIEGQPFDLLNLDDCEVQLLDHTDRVKMKDLRNSKVFVGACSSQVIVSHCRDCTFTLATREFYAHDTENCTFLLYSATPPEIEAATCLNLTFAPFNGRYEQHQENLAQAGLDPKENRWWEILPIVASDSEAGLEQEQEVVVPEGCYRLMPEEEYAASITPWEPLGECESCIPALWPAAPPSTATTAVPALYHAGGGSHPHLPAHEEGDGAETEAEAEEDVHVVDSPDQLFHSHSSVSEAKIPAGQGPVGNGGLRPSSSTNTLLPSLSAPTTPFSSHEGASTSSRAGRAQSHQPPLAPQPEHPGREQRALSHQPSSSASSNSLVGLAGAGLGGSAAPSPFNSARGVSVPPSAASSPFNSSRGGAAALGAGVEEKKDGALVPPTTTPAGGLQGHEGTTLADFDYDRWHAAWEERLRAKAAQEEQVARAARAQAEQDLDSYYDKFTDAKALRQERNREAEEAAMARIRESEAASDENPFKRVLELVGAHDSGVGPDMSRFRGLMISLREEGLPTKPHLARRPTLGADGDFDGGEDPASSQVRP